MNEETKLEFGIEIVSGMHASCRERDIETGRVYSLENTETDLVEGLAFESLSAENKGVWRNICRHEKERLHKQALYVADIAIAKLKDMKLYSGSKETEIRVCNNCDWVDKKKDTVHPKHDESMILCPECKETTEQVTANWFKELRTDKRKAVYWLIRTYIAYSREGWEEGPTMNEIHEKICDFLANRKLQPNYEDNAKNVEKFLIKMERKDLF